MFTISFIIFAGLFSFQVSSAESCVSAKLAELVADNNPTFTLLNKRLSDSGKFRLFRAGIGEVTFFERGVKPGKTYTALVHQRQIILGEGYLGPNGTTKRSHPVLLQDIKPEGISYRGGAVRVNIDGSIDVSGYHSGSDGNWSSGIMAKQFRDALPGVRVRAIGGRLSDLPYP